MVTTPLKKTNKYQITMRFTQMAWFDVILPKTLDNHACSL